MKTTACFDAATFQRLFAGQLTAAEVQAVSSHLEGCEHCVGIVRGLPDQTIGDAVRSANRPAHVQTLVAKVMQLRSGGNTLNRASPHNPTLDGPVPPIGSNPSATTIGRYRIIRELGRGGMGTVFEAEDPHLQRRVALKVPQFSGSAEKQSQMRQRFLREARAGAAVDHPNVCKIYDVGEQDGQPFVVMTFVEGASLADQLSPGRKVKERNAVILTLRIAEGLLAVHAHGIIHRDLKPANILMGKNTVPILTDFGLARMDADAEQLTGEGALLGTPAYMAPEQAVSDLGPVTQRTDLYSLAVILFQMLTGRLPVEGQMMHIIAHHMQGKPTPPASHIHPGIDPALDGILCRALTRRPEDRYPDVRAFVDVLKEWLRTKTAPGTGLVSAETVPVAPAPPPLPVAQILPAAPTEPLMSVSAALATPPVQPAESKPPRRLAWWHGVAGVLLLVGVVTAVIVILSGKDGKDDLPRGTAQMPDTEKDKDKDNKPSGPLQEINENFRNVVETGRTIPEGWKDEDTAFAVVEDDQGRPVLRVAKAKGDYLLTLPPLKLSGDFSIEGECYLDSANTGPGGVAQTLQFQLEAVKGSPGESVKIGWDGVVQVPDTAPNTAESISVHSQNHSEKQAIARPVPDHAGTGRALRVEIDNKHAVTKPLKTIVEFEAIRVSLVAGSGYYGHFARLYSLKVRAGTPERPPVTKQLDDPSKKK